MMIETDFDHDESAVKVLICLFSDETLIGKRAEELGNSEKLPFNAAVTQI